MGTSMVASAEDVRARVHGMWAAVAPGWAEHADAVDARTAGLTEELLRRTAPARGERVLELASGPGGAGLAAAPLVAPGEVVVSDVAEGMVRIAGDRARARRLANVSARVLDLERIDEPDASFDVVLCREGLMFAVEPGSAARELHRVLRPGGRAGISVWGPPERNGWLSVVFDAVRAETGEPVPPPGVPGPFSLGDADRLGRLLSDAGFADVVVTELAVPLRAPSFEDWWTRTRTIAGPLARRLAALPADASARLEERLRGAVEPYRTADGLELPGLALVASARRIMGSAP